MPSDKRFKVCNKVRIRISLKQKFHKSGNEQRGSDPATPTENCKSLLFVNLPHRNGEGEHY